MRLIATTFLALVITSPLAVASSSWGSPYKSYISGGIWRTTFNWGITLGGIPDYSPVECRTASCIVVVGTRSGVHPVSPGTCDSGGVCTGSKVMNPASGAKWVKVPRGASWDSAYSAFVAKYGTSGDGDTMMLPTSVIPRPNHPTWGVLCVGFISLPTTGSAISNLAPSTTCGLLNPPDLQCDIDITPVVDFGVINTGRNDLVSDTAQLFITCSSDAHVVASLTREHELAGVPLHMEIDGKRMTTIKREIYHGRSTTLPVTFRMAGDVQTAGKFQESVPVIMAYY